LAKRLAIATSRIGPDGLRRAQTAEPSSTYRFNPAAWACPRPWQRGARGTLWPGRAVTRKGKGSEGRAGRHDRPGPLIKERFP